MEGFQNIIARVDGLYAPHVYQCRSAKIRKLIAGVNGLDQEGVIVLCGVDPPLLDTVKEHAGKYHHIIVYNPKEQIAYDDERILQVDGQDFSWMDRLHKVMANGKYVIIKHTASVAQDQDRFDRFLASMQEHRRLVGANVCTTIGLGKKFMETYLENVPAIVKNPGVLPLQARFWGLPAVVISAGPSLAKSAEALRALKGRVLLIAVDAALPFLADSSIVPDIVVGIDPLPENARFYTTSMPTQPDYLDHVALVCLAQYTPDVIRQHPGPVFIADQPGNILYGWLAQFWAPKGNMNAFGGSVSHMAFALAEHMGCDPIVLTGQDLCFPGNDFYAPGIFRALHAEMEWDPRVGATQMKNVDGEDVYTTEILQAFRTSFEMHLRGTKTRVYNATPGGLAIAGAEACTLEIIERLRPAEETCEFINCFEARLFRIADFHGDRTWNKPGLIAELQAGVNILRQIERKAEYLQKQARRIGIWHEKKRTDEKFKHLLAHLSAEADRIAHPILNLMVPYHYQLELYLNRAQNREIDQIEDPVERLHRQVRRALEWYPALREAINLFIPHLEKLKKRLVNNG